MRKLLLAMSAGLALPALAAKIPEPAPNDPHIRFVKYRKDDVTIIQVQRGTVTRIVLGADEKIAREGSAAGFLSDCSKPELEWCIRAEAGTSQVLVKPMEGATHNNLELKTDARDYSFAFRVLPDTPTGKSAAGARPAETPMYRVIFTYPPKLPAIAAVLATAASAAPTNETSELEERLREAHPLPKNWKYALQAARGSGDIVPALTFDDGRFTYFRFPANREIPTIYAVSPQGEESRVNFHMDSIDNSLMVVERLSRRFVLRLGASAVGIWNEAFDANGVPAADGTTVAGVARVLREGK